MLTLSEYQSTLFDELPAISCHFKAPLTTLHQSSDPFTSGEPTLVRDHLPELGAVYELLDHPSPLSFEKSSEYKEDVTVPEAVASKEMVLPAEYTISEPALTVDGELTVPVPVAIFIEVALVLVILTLPLAPLLASLFILV
jgi:hypothetical protein